MMFFCRHLSTVPEEVVAGVDGVAVLHERVRDVEAGGGRDPLPRVDAAVEPDPGLGGGPGLPHHQHVDTATLVAGGQRVLRDCKGIQSVLTEESCIQNFSKNFSITTIHFSESVSKMFIAIDN